MVQEVDLIPPIIHDAFRAKKEHKDSNDDETLEYRMRLATFGLMPPPVFVEHIDPHEISQQLVNAKEYIFAKLYEQPNYGVRGKWRKVFYELSAGNLTNDPEAPENDFVRAELKDGVSKRVVHYFLLVTGDSVEQRLYKGEPDSENYMQHVETITDQLRNGRVITLLADIVKEPTIASAIKIV
jgi:hypothetical protein